MSSQAEVSDDQLIRRLLRGHEDAFTAIYRRCSGPVYRFALHMTGDPNMAEEITQETFVFLLANAGAFDANRGSLLSWLLGVARNQSRRALGPLNETAALDDSPERDLARDSDPLGEFTRRELIDAVRRAIGSLPAALREVVILCELQELDYREAAAVLACPVGTVRSRLHRARALLVSKLQARCMA
jgi:RNA polymerase sigma-70 factor (ECF subfamily)